jgi:hypothetical protein
MRLARLMAVLALIAPLTACAQQALRVRYERYGDVDAAPDAPHLVPSPAAVRVLSGTAPPGFYLRGGVIGVAPGSSHRVLGTVAIDYEHPPCNDTRFLKTRDDLIGALRQAAYERGGNAVIFATIAIAEGAKPDEVCETLRGQRRVASGWVAVVADEPAAVEPQAAPPI